MREYYLDFAATTPVREEVLNTYTVATKKYFGNAHSLHKFGAEAEKLYEQARNQIAKYLGVKSKEIYFTSGATEGNNFALKGMAEAYKNRGTHIITTSIEHASVFNTCRYLETIGYEVTYLSVNNLGMIDANDLKNAIRKDTIIVSVMHVNSEMGAIQPLKEVVEVLKSHPNIKLHVDATQSFGKLDLSIEGIDCLTFSAHKIGGLQSSGFIYIKEGLNLIPLFHGGQHERGLRAGTQSVALGASIAKAVRLAMESREERYNNVLHINKSLREELKDLVVFNSTLSGSPYILNMSIPHVKPETVLHSLEEFGIYISTKSACSSRSNNISRVIDEVTHDETLASSSIRISFYDFMENDDIMYIAQSIKTVINRLKEVVSS